MEIGTIRQINIDVEMQASYLDYAMSVIVARALPDVRDGLKPVHRRILYAMHDLGLTADKPYKKSARIVGEVLGKYHPHGDAAVYEAMVRMAQDFSLRYPLVDGQGNFGSVDGDNAAAMRYTEARLSPIANEMLADIDKDTVDWGDNFDGTLKEPLVLPGALPNLIVNGASGIAVGMATNIPPHNLGEVCDALVYVIDNYDCQEEITAEDLMKFIQGPDFPTGGVIYRYSHEGNGTDAEQVDAIERAYGTGRGSLVVQAKAHIEEMSRSKNRIVITELPYQTDKSRLMERIAELVREGRLEGLTDLRDESDRTGMRIMIELTRTVDPRQVLADLYKYTPLQTTFGVSLLALVDGEPRLLSMKRMLLHYLEHRQVVIVRRSRFELARAKARAHILEGLLRALDMLDEIIALIRRSRTADSARNSLVRDFHFTELQAQAILDMQLRRLAALERQKLQDEQKQLLKLIKELEALLASPQKVLALIRQNLIDLKAQYGDARRTQIADRVKGALTSSDMVEDRPLVITVSADGKIARREAEAATLKKLPQLLGQAGSGLVVAGSRQDLYLFTVAGQAVRIPAHQVPEAPGGALAHVAGVRARVVAVHSFERGELGEGVAQYLFLGTAMGKVKRVALADLFSAAHTNPAVINIESGDELAWAEVGSGEGELLMLTSGGQAIRFPQDEVRAMGLPAGGIGGIRLRGSDKVVAGFALPNGASNTIAIVTANAFAKQVPLSDFPVQGRNGMGVVAAKPTPRTGQVSGGGPLVAGDALLLYGGEGHGMLFTHRDLPTAARAAGGKAIAGWPKGQAVLRAWTLCGDCLSPAGDGAGKSGRSGAGGASAPARKARASAAAEAKPAPKVKASVAAEANPAAKVEATVAAEATPPGKPKAGASAADKLAEQPKATAVAGKKPVVKVKVARSRTSESGAAAAASPARAGKSSRTTKAAPAAQTARAAAAAKAPPVEVDATAKAGSRPQPAPAPVAARGAGVRAAGAAAAAPTPAATAAAPAAAAGTGRKPPAPKAVAPAAGAKVPAVRTKAKPAAKAVDVPVTRSRAGSVPEPAAAEQPKPPRARRPAADGPMTWSLFPDSEAGDSSGPDIPIPAKPRARPRR